MNKYQEIVKEDLLPCPICGEDNADFVAIEDTGPNRGAGLAVMCDCGCAVMTGIEYNISGNSLEELCSASAQWNKRRCPVTKTTVDFIDVSIDSFRDGGLILSCDVPGFISGAEADLVFANGAMVEEDPLMKRQRAVLEYLVKAVNWYQGHRGTEKEKVA